jgi:hypothetical protein
MSRQVRYRRCTGSENHRCRDWQSDWRRANVIVSIRVRTLTKLPSPNAHDSHQLSESFPDKIRQYY